MISCDFHVHLGKSRDGAGLSTEELLRDLKKYGVKRAVVFPVDEPDVGLTYERQNDAILEAAKVHPELIPFCRLNPTHPKAAFAEMERCYRAGFRGLKLHPRSESILPNTLHHFFGEASTWDWPVVMHISHERNCHPRSWEESFRRFPKIKFILAHGGKDSYQETMEVAERCPNVFMDTSTLSVNRTKVMVNRLGPQRILFASDQPYSHIAVEQLKFELILAPKDLVVVFEENARLFFPDLF